MVSSYDFFSHVLNRNFSLTFDTTKIKALIFTIIIN